MPGESVVLGVGLRHLAIPVIISDLFCFVSLALIRHEPDSVQVRPIS
jgi:hypothetical protein